MKRIRFEISSQTPDYHRALGTALGYDGTAIENFITNHPNPFISGKKVNPNFSADIPKEGYNTGRIRDRIDYLKDKKAHFFAKGSSRLAFATVTGEALLGSVLIGNAIHQWWEARKHPNTNKSKKNSILADIAHCIELGSGVLILSSALLDAKTMHTGSYKAFL